MARSVEHVHNLNFVHLDIKPSNFLINQSHQVKLADFGIALDLTQTSLIQDND
jgi:serine/threonine-protein kinase